MAVTRALRVGGCGNGYSCEGEGAILRQEMSSAQAIQKDGKGDGGARTGWRRYEEEGGRGGMRKQ